MKRLCVVTGEMIRILLFFPSPVGEDLKNEANPPKALSLVCGSVYNGSGLLISSRNVPPCASACAVCSLEGAALSDPRGACRLRLGTSWLETLPAPGFVSIFCSVAKPGIKMQQQQQQTSWLW